MQKVDVRSVRMTVQSRGQVTLPKQMREAMGLEPGDIVIAVPERDGTFRLERFERMSLDAIIARWGDPTPRNVDEVDSLIEEAREAYADELAKEYGE